MHILKLKGLKNGSLGLTQGALDVLVNGLGQLPLENAQATNGSGPVFTVLYFDKGDIKENPWPHFHLYEFHPDSPKGKKIILGPAHDLRFHKAKRASFRGFHEAIGYFDFMCELDASLHGVEAQAVAQ